MAADRQTESTGWSIIRSVAMELDIALSPFSGYETPAEAATVIRDLPLDWQEQWPELLGAPRKWIGLLTQMAGLAGVLTEEDYSKATLAMRELTLDQALAAAAASLRAYNIQPDESAQPPERLARIATQLLPALNQAVGLTPADEAAWVRAGAYEMQRLPALLKGGDLHARFWLWLDRFYFEFYRPWREARLPLMEREEARAIAALGARAGEAPPVLDWLPYENPLIFLPELTGAVQERKVRVLFWTQPFGFFDYWSPQPGLLIASYGQPHQPLSDYLRGRAEPLAERVKALSDPTRLMLLRLIRNFAMDNTQMADLLGIARPTVSIHAKLLREAGLIETRPRGRAVVHTLDARSLRHLFREIEQFLQLPEAEEKN